ncbi:MAG: glutamate synthase large subunit [Gammaproteobacteria bacterium]|nr:glutamate synthase large subunit [Gammaproteobacteria bacterium]
MKQFVGHPAEGLYDPNHEHDSCGVGFVVDMKGRKSHKIVSDALTILKNLLHRGACGCEENTGDGVGILLQKPHKFFLRECKKLAIELPQDPEQYGAGMIFLPRDPQQSSQVQEIINRIVKQEGQTVLGWRDVPTDDSMIGPTALAGEPTFKQIFILRNSELDAAAFDRKLYVIRKCAEQEIWNSDLSERDLFYVPSLSYRTFLYKGMLTGDQIEPMFPDITDPDVESAMALVHQRFSTNTFPSWRLAQPFRYISHNGEINTVRGNANWMRARQTLCESDLFKDDLQKLFPVVIEGGSDSACFDNVMEFLHLNGRPLPLAVLMMIPEAWSGHKSMDKERKAFYEYHACLMEPWDGPASIAFMDGEVIGAVLDRNGLRPSRYYVTKDDMVIMASEVGVLDIAPENVAIKERLHPGRIFMVDTRAGRIIDDEELKKKLVSEHPYADWLKKNLIPLNKLPIPKSVYGSDPKTLLKCQQAFGYTHEDLKLIMAPMAIEGEEPIGSMGTDASLAVLSNRSRLLYDYFKQLFAQVTNPPLDGIREKLITQLSSTMGPERNLLKPTPESCRQIKLETPILKNEQLARIKEVNLPGHKSKTVQILYPVAKGGAGLDEALKQVCRQVDLAIEEGYTYVILSDRGIDADNAAIPALLAVSGVHHHLTRNGQRTKLGLILESGEPREVHHFAVLIGYGVHAINPYLAFETLESMIGQGLIPQIDYETATENYIKAANKGLIKAMSKMGISTLQSYRGAQIFEAIGLDKAFVDRYFTWTVTRVGGIGLETVAEEVSIRHHNAFPRRTVKKPDLEWGGEYQWRRDGEYHAFNPDNVVKLQNATRNNDYALYKEYAASIDEQAEHLATLRGLFDLQWAEKPLSLDEVEPLENILARFSTGAMSYGSISQEAHETLAIAMNRIGGKSNTGEGGEDPARFKPDANGDLRRSAIKQVASGRFGVTAEYLTNADDIQIKMAQGAKPGEGGQLPGTKVYPWIAKVRHSTAGVGLISPPPHHDIYSIEDLAQLIHDLKNANPKARIHVKLVAEIGIGTVAAGVAKAHSDVVLISGYDGGTGASPISSLKHVGLPWELGLAETQQTLVLNKLRDRIVVQVDGQMKTGRDVIIAALLGGEEFGFSTAPLVTMGCIMMRKCHSNTCPVGVATQDPKLRKKFTGKPEYVVSYFRFLAQEVREYMAKLGFRTFDEMIGQVDRINIRKAVDHWKAKGLDFSMILHKPEMGPEVGIYCQRKQDHGLDQSLDVTTLLPLCKDAIEEGKELEATLPIKNTNRTVGTIVGHEITKRYGSVGLWEDTIKILFIGSAGMSFGAFIPRGMTLAIEGDANDYLGKGLSGGKIIVYPPRDSTFKPEENIIAGNVLLYGATQGEVYIRGIAGERFCVRNSGAHAVVEGVGEHGCEYMTGGRVVVIGRTGRNFAAGMSGGVAYILDEQGDFSIRCNQDMVDLDPLIEDEDVKLVQSLLTKHVSYTQSTVAENILENWSDYRQKFVKVMPRDYKRVLNAIKMAKEKGLPEDEAIMEASHG